MNSMLSMGLSPVEALYAAVRAQTEELQPVFADPVACLFGNGLCQHIQIVAFEECHLSAVLAKQQVLMTVTRRDKSLASHRLMYTLNEMQLFELFQRAINRDQSEGVIFFACHVVHLNGGQGAGRFLHRFNHRAARPGDAIAILDVIG